jgi:SP family sugar:H+ symporter-like MFS transporter
MIYETKGLSLEQVDELYGVVGKAWQSKSFEPSVSFQDVDHTGQRRNKSLDHGESVTTEKV